MSAPGLYDPTSIMNAGILNFTFGIFLKKFLLCNMNMRTNIILQIHYRNVSARVGLS